MDLRVLGHIETVDSFWELDKRSRLAMIMITYSSFNNNALIKFLLTALQTWAGKSERTAIKQSFNFFLTHCVKAIGVCVKFIFRH